MQKENSQIVKFIKGSPVLYAAAKALLNLPHATITELRCLPIRLGGTVHEIQGSKMFLDVYEKDPSLRRTFRAYALNRIHEETTTQLFKRLVRKGDLVLDLGANVGYFSMLAAKLAGAEGKVYAFEPEPRNYRYLCRNLELNGYANVVALQKAVADGPGSVRLFICPYDTGHHTIRNYDGIAAYRPGFVDSNKAYVDVEQVSLDTLLGDLTRPIDLIKMDVEGAEVLALQGMRNLLERNRKLAMIVEFFPLLIRKMGQSPEEFIRCLLDDFGCRISVIGHDYSMAARESAQDLGRVHSVDEVMELCQGTADHVNLLVTRPDFDRA